MRDGTKLNVVFDRLKESFEEPKDIPGLDSVSRAVYEVLYSSGLCDLAAFDLRTSGTYHDFIEGLVQYSEEENPEEVSRVCEGERLLARQGDPSRAEPSVLLDELVRECSRSKLLAILDARRLELASGLSSPESCIDSISSDARSVSRASNANKRSWVDCVQAAANDLSDAGVYAGSAKLVSGLSELDGLVKWRRSSMTIVGAATSHGKTAFATRMTAQALRLGLRPLLVLFEDYSVFPYKLASCMYQVPLKNFIWYSMVDAQGKRDAENALSLVKDYEKQLIVLPDTQLSELEGIARNEKPDLIILDYIQKYAEAYGKGDSRRDCSSGASKFQDIAKSVGCYSILTSQIRRREQVNKSGGGPRMPALYDLKESGDLENYADTVLLLWWPWKDQNEEGAKKLDKADYRIIVAKDKLGPGGECRCLFNGESLLFQDRFTLGVTGGETYKGQEA